MAFQPKVNTRPQQCLLNLLLGLEDEMLERSDLRACAENFVCKFEINGSQRDLFS
jgi:hypothetical protein